MAHAQRQQHLAWRLPGQLAEAFEESRARQPGAGRHALQCPGFAGLLDQLLEQPGERRLPSKRDQPAQGLPGMHLLAQCIQKEQVRQALQKGLRRPGLALAFVQDQPEQRPRRAPGGVFGTQQDPVDAVAHRRLPRPGRWTGDNPGRATGIRRRLFSGTPAAPGRRGAASNRPAPPSGSWHGPYLGCWRASRHSSGRHETGWHPAPDLLITNRRARRTKSSNAKTQEQGKATDEYGGYFL